MEFYLRVTLKQHQPGSEASKIDLCCPVIISKESMKPFRFQVYSLIFSKTNEIQEDFGNNREYVITGNYFFNNYLYYVHCEMRRCQIMLLSTQFPKMDCVLLYSIQDKQSQCKILLLRRRKRIKKVLRILLQPIKVLHPLCPVFYWKEKQLGAQPSPVLETFFA